jgi:hypothetical protein
MSLQLEEAAQYRAVGNVFLFMGALSLTASIAAMRTHLELRFIDAPTMAVFGFIMMALGLWQRRLGHFENVD